MKKLFTLTIALICFTCLVFSQSSSEHANYDKYIRGNEQKHTQELTEFISIQSISSLPAHKNDVQRAAEWLKNKLLAIGMSRADVFPTDGHPIVFAEWNKAKDKPTVLVYGHYDVQPVKEAEWTNPPFLAKVENGRIYGRGAVDDKGGLLIPIWAAEAIFKEKGALPVNLILLFDGEEEMGSPNFRNFVQQHRSLLRADFAYNADGAQYSDSVPSIWMSLRGNAGLEFTAKTAHTDAHSGIYGGKTPNAAKAAAEIISSLYTKGGKVAVAGFYDAVQPLSKEERDQLSRVPYDESNDMKVFGYQSGRRRRGISAAGTSLVSSYP